MRHNGGVRNAYDARRRAAAVESVLEVDGLRVAVTRKPIRNAYLRVRPPAGAVAVSAPMRMADARIVAFVRERRAWIARQQTRMREQQRIAERELAAAGMLGEPGALGEPGSSAVAPGGPFATGLSGPTASPSVWTDARRAEAAAAIEARLPALLDRWTPVVGRTPTQITLRAMTSRWGSCTPRTGRIRLNLQLGLMEPRFLEYVLVHELTHLWEHGHGAGFQRRMSAYLPEWRALRRELNHHLVLR